MEVLTSSHSHDEAIRYADTALELGRTASRGSDFQAPGESRVEPGALPDLPGRVTPAWTLLADRIAWPAPAA